MTHDELSLSESLQAKLNKLRAVFVGYGRCVVAISGGLDSAVAAKAAALALGDRACAVTAIGPSMAPRETQDARRVAKEIGMMHEEIRTEESELPEYIENGPLRCYYCKRHIFSRIADYGESLGIETIVDGANTDDLKDYRPGIEAARELGVRSPLAEVGINKGELRRIAAYWGLSVQDKPPSPCLASRIAYGVEITPRRLEMVAAAEAFLAEQGFDHFRVRLHRDELARVEVPLERLSALTEAPFRRLLVKTILECGFRFVTLDLEGLTSGSLNRTLEISESGLPKTRGTGA